MSSSRCSEIGSRGQMNMKVAARPSLLRATSVPKQWSVSIELRKQTTGDLCINIACRGALALWIKFEIELKITKNSNFECFNRGDSHKRLIGSCEEEQIVQTLQDLQVLVPSYFSVIIPTLSFTKQKRLAWMRRWPIHQCRESSVRPWVHTQTNGVAGRRDDPPPAPMRPPLLRTHFFEHCKIEIRISDETMRKREMNTKQCSSNNQSSES